MDVREQVAKNESQVPTMPTMPQSKNVTSEQTGTAANSEPVKTKQSTSLVRLQQQTNRATSSRPNSSSKTWTRNAKVSPSPEPNAARRPTPKKPNVQISHLGPEALDHGVLTRLRERKYEAAVDWIQCSEYLSSKYKLADVVKEAIENKQFDIAGSIIRKLQLQQNHRILVSLFIKGLVGADQFNLAFRYAKEFYPDFGKSSDESPAWKPETLIGAMLRRGHFSAGLRYAKDYNLLDRFPPAQIVNSMILKNRKWLEAFTIVKRFQLEAQFPLKKFVEQMILIGEWKSAIKCVNETRAIREHFPPIFIVQYMIHSKYFLEAIKYIREFRLIRINEGEVEIPEASKPILCQLIDAMVNAKEHYKAIKYAAKFNITSLDTEKYSMETMIRQAFLDEQYHVGKMFIQKFTLAAKFQESEIKDMESKQRQMGQRFRNVLNKLHERYEAQQPLRQELGFVYTDDEIVDVEVVEENVLSISEEIIPKKKKTPTTNAVDEVIGSQNPPDAAKPNIAMNSENTFNFTEFSTQIQGSSETTPAIPNASTIPTIAPPAPAVVDINNLVMQFHSNPTIIPPMPAGFGAPLQPRATFVPPVTATTKQWSSNPRP